MVVCVLLFCCFLCVGFFVCFCFFLKKAFNIGLRSYAYEPIFSKFGIAIDMTKFHSLIPVEWP